MNNPDATPQLDPNAPWLTAGLDATRDSLDVAAEWRADFTGGGLVTGPGTETSDAISAFILPGAFVLNAEAVRVIGLDNLEKINQAAHELVPVRLSAGEFVVNPAVGILFHPDFFSEINKAGLRKRQGATFENPEKQAEYDTAISESIAEVMTEVNDLFGGDQ